MFGPKDDGIDIHGLITREGSGFFNEARAQVFDLYVKVFGREPAAVSDADVIEYLARGVRETRKYFRARKRTGG